MNIDINQYDLNELFRFDLLKNILLNITEEQKKINEELNQLKLSNKIRDDKIKNLEKINTFKSLGFEDELNKLDYEESTENNIRDNNENKENAQLENNEPNFEEQNKNNININSENKILTPKILENKNIILNKQETNNKNLKRSLLHQDNKNQNSKSTLLFFMKETHSLEEKIINLENKLKNQFENQISKIEEDSKKNINSLSEEYKSAYGKIDEQLSNLLQIKEEQNRKIEDCILKCDSVDIYNLLKNSGDSNLDAAKLMINTLEEKVFKKFSFIDERNKKETEDIIKLLKADELKNMKLEKIEKNLNDVKYNDIGQVRETFKKNLSEYDKKFSDVINSLSEQEIDLSQKISELETNILGILEEKEVLLNKNSESIIDVQNDLKKIQNELDISNKKQTAIFQELGNDFDRKINYSKNRINSIETTLKSINDSFDPRKLYENINEIKQVLEEKITKEHLKELYSLNMNNTEDISNTRKTILTVQEELKKVTIDVDNIVPKVNSFMTYLITKKAKKKEAKKNEIDFEQFIDKTKFEEMIKYFTRRIESIFIEIESVKRNLDDVKIEQKSFEKRDVIIKMEEGFNILLDDNKSKIQKNKNELNKQIKGLEVEIKSIWTELKKRESADNWILAKQPIKCFNCATCDNDIKIDSQRGEEYVPWNKILPNNRSYRLGKGFSHMLEKISYDIIKSEEENNEGKENTQFISDKNIKNSSSQNFVNSSTQMEENKINFNDKINNIAQIERSNSLPKMAVIKGRNLKSVNSERMRLPQVVDMAKKKAIFDTFKNISSVSEREKLTIKEYSLKNQLRINSPKIVKIKKKNIVQNISFVQTSKNEKK